MSIAVENKVAHLIEEALEGDRIAQAHIKNGILGRGTEFVEEAHSTSDFGAAFLAVTERQFQAEYPQIETNYTEFTRDFKVNSLRPAAFFSLQADPTVRPDTNAGQGVITEAPGGLASIPELTEYPEISFKASETSVSVSKYGNRVNFSFEMLLDDQWGVLESLPTELANLARNQEAIVATEVLASETGPNPEFFNAANQNIIAGAPALSIEALDEARNAINSRKFNGNPVRVPQLALVVPPELEMLARQILGITTLQVTDTNGTYQINNPVSGIRLVVEPWLTIIDKSATARSTWYLVPYQGQGVRPSIVFSKMRGRETPELRISNDTGLYLGGGAVPGREGSFLNDDIQFRVRHFVGAAGIAPETVAVSLGTN